MEVASLFCMLVNNLCSFGQHLVNKSDYMYSESVFKCTGKVIKIGCNVLISEALQPKLLIVYRIETISN